MSQAVPSFDEALTAQQQPQAMPSKAPSFEEALATQQKESEFGFLEEDKKPFVTGEDVIRAGREVVSGATLGASDIFTIGGTAVTQAVIDALNSGDISSAKNIVEQAQKNYAADLKKQQEFREQNPALTLGAQVAGGVIPGSAAARVAKIGLEASPTLYSGLKQAAKAGALGAGAYAAAQEVAKVPAGSSELGSAVENILGSTAIGGVSAPTVGLGLQAAGVAIPYAAQKIKQAADGGLRETIGNVMLSKPARAFVQVLLGPRITAQEKYIQMLDELGDEVANLPSTQTVAGALKSIKEIVERDAERAGKSAEELAQNYLDLSKALEKKESEVTGQMRDNLRFAREDLDKTVGALRSRAETAAKSARSQEAGLAESLKEPSMGTFSSEVSDAISTLKRNIVDGSRLAREKIDPNFRMPKSSIISALRSAKGMLSVQGTGVAIGQRRKAEGYIDGFIKQIEEMPEELSGNQVKDILQAIDQEIDNPNLTEFGSSTSSTFSSARRQIDAALKDQNKEYAESMLQVSQQREFLEKLDDSGFSTIQGIESRLKQAADNPRVEDLLLELQKLTGLKTTRGVEEIRASRFAKLNQAELAKQLPAVQELDDLRKLISLKEDPNFEKVVLESISDKETANKIINLRTTIKLLQDPNYRQKQIDLALREGKINAETALVLRDKAIKEYQMLSDRAYQMSKYELGEQGLAKILRNPLGSSEGVEATRLINAISELPPEQFQSVAEALGISSIADFRDIARYLRVEEGMKKAVVSGSARTLVHRAIGTALRVAVSANVGNEIAGTTGGAIGAITGFLMDTEGPQIAKNYLKMAHSIRGIPTVRKMERAVPIPVSPTIRNAITMGVLNQLKDVDQEGSVYVSEDRIPDIIEDIQNSKLPSTKKAKAVTDLQRFNMVDGAILRSVMLEGSTPMSKKAETAIGLVEKSKPKEIKEDRPDILKKMTARKPAQQEVYAAEEPEEIGTPEAPASLDEMIKFYKEQGFPEDMAVTQAQRDLDLAPEEEGEEGTNQSELFRRISQVMREMQMKGRISEQ